MSFSVPKQSWITRSVDNELKFPVDMLTQTFQAKYACSRRKLWQTRLDLTVDASLLDQGQRSFHYMLSRL